MEVVAATDVDNPLNGPAGAAAVFAPQKGADPPTVEILAARLAGIGAELDRFAGRAVTAEPGAGAAGGIGAALLSLGAHRASGADLVAQITGLRGLWRPPMWSSPGRGVSTIRRRGKGRRPVAAAAPPHAQVIALVGDAVPAGRALREELGLDVIESLVDHVGLEAALHDAEASRLPWPLLSPQWSSSTAAHAGTIARSREFPRMEYRCYERPDDKGVIQ